MDSPVVKFSMGLIGSRNRKIIRATICDMLVLPDAIDNELSLTGYYEPLEEGADRAYLAFMTFFDEVRKRFGFYRETLRSVKIPSMVIWGIHDDTLVAEEAVPLFQEDLGTPNSQVFLRGDAKHLIMEEVPEFIAARITEFLSV